MNLSRLLVSFSGVVRTVGLTAALGYLLVIILSGCGSKFKEDPIPKRLRVAVLPDQDSKKLQTRNQSLIRYLSDQLNIPCELVIPADYEDAINLFAEHKVDLSWFGGFTYVLAERRIKTLPLVMRECDQHFSSVLLAKSASAGHSLGSFAKGRIAFGSKFSTSGYLMPRLHLMRMGLVPERDFSEVIFSGSHNRTVRMVSEGKADLGAANQMIFDEMVKNGEVGANELVVVSQTPPFVDYVWAVPQSMAYNLRSSIEAAFLELSRENPAHAPVLRDQGARVFFPAHQNDFSEIREAVDLLQKQEKGG